MVRGERRASLFPPLSPACRRQLWRCLTSPGIPGYQHALIESRPWRNSRSTFIAKQTPGPATAHRVAGGARAAHMGLLIQSLLPEDTDSWRSILMGDGHENMRFPLPRRDTPACVRRDVAKYVKLAWRPPLSGRDRLRERSRPFPRGQGKSLTSTFAGSTGPATPEMI